MSAIDLSNVELLRYPNKEDREVTNREQILVEFCRIGLDRNDSTGRDLAVYKAGYEKSQKNMLDWFDEICRQGMTIGMLRRAIHNKRVEITGEGEKA